MVRWVSSTGSKLYEHLLEVARKKTSTADVKLDERGKPVIVDDELDLGENVLIVDHTVPLDAVTDVPPTK